MTHTVAQSLSAYPAAMLDIVDGANIGDGLGTSKDIQLDDICHLRPGIARRRLAVSADAEGALELAHDSELGTPGHKLYLDSCVTFMEPAGTTTDILVAVEVDHDGMIEELFAIPLNTLIPQCDYRIIGIDCAIARRKLAEIGCVSFARGTHITMATGAQRRVEDLVPGDRVLTRDAGPQEVRWIGQSTQKAEGAFAPILIKAGTLNNLGDLLVSPDHRLFIYQREDRLGAGRSEVLVRAKYLVNGDTVLRQDGGYIDYFQLLFDDHQIIYAEGISAESLMIDTTTEPALPPEWSAWHGGGAPGRDTGLRAEYEVSEHVARRPDAADLLRRASAR